MTPPGPTASSAGPVRDASLPVIRRAVGAIVGVAGGGPHADRGLLHRVGQRQDGPHPGGGGRKPQAPGRGVLQNTLDSLEALVHGALDLRVVPDDLREGHEPGALGPQGLRAGDQQRPEVLQEGPLAGHEGLDRLGLRGLRADDEELDLGGEVVEDRAAGDPGESGDVVDRHGRVTALTGQRQGGRPNGGAGASRVGSAQVGPSHDPNHALSAELHSMQKVRDQSPVGEPAALGGRERVDGQGTKGRARGRPPWAVVSASSPGRARAPAGHPMTVNTPGTPRREAPWPPPGPTARTRGRR